MPNQIEYYDASTAITTTPTPAFVLGPGYNVLEVQNDTDLDIIVNFSRGGAGANMLVKAGNKKIQNFVCTGTVTLTSASSSTGNFFIQASVG
jgi:hypothetical protein